MSHLPVARIVAEIDQTEAALAQYGKRSVAFRPPFGEWSSRLVDVVQDLQLPTVTWDVVSGDPSARTTTDGMIRTVVEQGARRIDRRLSHQRARSQDGRGAARHRPRAPRARLPLRAGVGADGGVGAARVPVAPIPLAPLPPAAVRSLPASAAPIPAARIPAAAPPAPGPLTGGRTWRSAKIVRASPPWRARQAAWIAGIEPWRGLGYRAAPLGRYLARLARAGEVWVAPGRRRARTRARRSSSRRTVSCWAGSSRCWRCSPDASGQGSGPRWSRTSRRACSPGGAGFSSPATPTTAPRCVSTAGRASPASAGFPISCARGASSSAAQTDRSRRSVQRLRHRRPGTIGPADDRGTVRELSLDRAAG